MSDPTATPSQAPDTTDGEAKTEASESPIEAKAEPSEPAVEAAPEAEAKTTTEEEQTEPVAEAAEAEATEQAEAKAEEAEPAAEAKAEEAEPAAEAKAEEAEPDAEAKAEEAEPAAEAKAEEAEPAAEAKAEEAEPAAEAKAEEAEPAAEAKAEEAEPAAEAKAEEAEPAAEAKAEEAEPAAEAKAEKTEPAAEAAAAKANEAADDGSKDAPTGPALQSEELAQLNAAKESKTPVVGRVIGWNKGGYHVAVDKVAAFCPVSQIEIGNPRSPKKYLDKEFPFHVIEVQKDGRRVVLSRASALKAERQAQAAKVREQLKPNAEMEGRVSSITDFGAFVDLGGGIEGLVHISEVSRRRVEHAKEVLKVGQQVKVAVLKVEKNGKRISLSMKRLEPDPWNGVQERFAVGGEFKGKIVRKTDFGLFVEVEPGLEGLVHQSRLPLGTTLSDESLEPGAEITGWVHEVERKRRRLSLSMRPVAEGNPWKDVSDRYPEGELVTGKVERLADFGAFIELEPGLTGLLPFSVVGGVGNPKRQFQVGKEVKVKVLAIDRDKKRISLGTEASKAEGSIQDYKEYMKSQGRGSSDKGGGSGLNAMAAALAKLKDQMATTNQ